MSDIISKYYAFKFILTITKDWKEMKAFELGIIDDKGNKLKSPSTQEERNSYNSFNRLVFNLKRLLEKVPLGKSTIARYSAALVLLKEEFPGTEQIAIDYINESLNMKDNNDNLVEELVTTAGVDMSDGVFAGSKVFKVPTESILKTKNGKPLFARYKTFVGEDESGQQIRSYGLKNPGKGIIIKDSTGAMVFLRKPIK